MRFRQIAPIYLVLLAVAFLVGRSSAQTETLIYSFKGVPDGANPQSGLIADSEGNGYGTTFAGGDSACVKGGGGCGTVYKISSSGESVIHAFTGGKTDGCFPYGPLVMDKSGNLYGTTNGCGTNNTGTVFKISPSGVETILHNFGVAFLSGDGSAPRGGLAIDAQGNLYGTTSAGGVIPAVGGTVFKITPTGTETVLYSFTGGADGGTPIAGPTVDPSGNIYGTTYGGGTHSEGTVFEVSASGTETVLHSFGAPGDGLLPEAGVTFGKNGNLYGTTFGGGTGGAGTVYVVNVPTKTESILYNFDIVLNDGVEPYAGVTFDAAKTNLYGATTGGGAFGVGGTVYEVTPSGNNEVILHSFGATGDGSLAYGNVILNGSGVIYGTTFSGGKYGFGTIYRVIP